MDKFKSLKSKFELPLYWNTICEGANSVAFLRLRGLSLAMYSSTLLAFEHEYMESWSLECGVWPLAKFKLLESKFELLLFWDTISVGGNSAASLRLRGLSLGMYTSTFLAFEHEFMGTWLADSLTTFKSLESKLEHSLFWNTIRVGGNGTASLRLRGLSLAFEHEFMESWSLEFGVWPLARFK